MDNEPQKNELKPRVRRRSNRKRMMAAKVPDELYRGLAMWACDNNVSKSEAIRIAVDLLISPANRKDELFDKLDAIERKVEDVNVQTAQVSEGIDVVRELLSALAKSVFYYAVQPADKERSRLNMDKRFNGYIRLAVERVLSKASHSEMGGQDKGNGGFL